MNWGERFINTLDLHSMDNMIMSTRHAYHNDQLTNDVLQHIRIK